MSPLHRVRVGMPPALFAVGGLETAAFQQQTADMHAAWLTPATAAGTWWWTAQTISACCGTCNGLDCYLQGILDLIQHA